MQDLGGKTVYVFLALVIQDNLYNGRNHTANKVKVVKIF